MSVGVPQGFVFGPVLYLMYTSPIIDVIKNYNINYFLYAGDIDSQFYIAFKTSNFSSVQKRIENSVGDLSLDGMQ